jgi:hypothetical protein
LNSVYPAWHQSALAKLGAASGKQSGPYWQSWLLGA